MDPLATRCSNSRDNYLLTSREIETPVAAPSTANSVLSNNKLENIDTFWESCWKRCAPKKDYRPRVITLGRPASQKFPPNRVCNQKYNLFSFLPLVLWEQFSVFTNLIFLVMACSQFVPALRVGYLYTYWGPLGFVISVTMIREAVDDLRRWKRDREVNLTAYTKLGVTADKSGHVTAAQIKLGDLLWIHKDQRVPADLVLLYTTERNGACFIRTDQLDGETDWKLRHAVPFTQHLLANNNENTDDLFTTLATVYAEKPNQSIHSFEGTFTAAKSECQFSH
ncbi:ATP synthase subunit 9 [Cichlidogyrus casuarinus]|uniref:ATP synthase subunit 9 n=1 Tax=Cichlidogyrus casuarinus TaxID=1844966 RepID=A0ABD2QM13_9PLAT